MKSMRILSRFPLAFFQPETGILQVKNVKKCSVNFYSTKPALKNQKEVNVSSSSRSSSRISLERRRMDVGGFNVSYTQVGSGDHVILGLPGVLGTIQTDFEPILSRINLKKFKMVVWDPPGYGESKLATGFRKLTHKNDVEDAVAASQLMKNLGFDRYSLVAWSRGAVTGIRLLTQNPGCVDKLIFWGAPAYSDEHNVQLAKLSCNLNSFPKELADMYIQTYGKETFQNMLNDIRDYVAHSYRTGNFQIKLLMSQVKVPTLIIHGQNDINCVPNHARIYHEQIPNSKLEIWKDSTHFLHLEHTEKLVKRVEKFLLQSI